MSRSAEDWKAVYGPMLGQRLGGLWFYPLTCDTPDVARDLRDSVIGFSGAVGLAFENGPDHYLTWRQVTAADFELSSYGREDEVWGRSVDRIRMSPEDPWAKALGGQLTKVEMYACKGAFVEPITTAAHHLHKVDGDAVLWISTASGSSPGPGDDLLVTLDHNLTNPGLFKLAVTIQ